MAGLRTSVYTLATAGSVLSATLLHAGTAQAQSVEPSPARIEADLDLLSDSAQSSAGALALARQQQASGNLTGAASTLERALIANSDADDVRLAYAAVLCRLDDRQSARQELRQLSGGPAGHAQWAEVKAACGSSLIGQASATRLLGEASVGLVYDGDAFGVLNVERLGPVTSHGGLAAQTALHLAGTVALPQGEIYARASIDSRNKLSGPSDDYQLAQLAAGYGGNWGLAHFAAGGVFRHAWIYGTNYVSEYGGQLRLDAPVGGHGRLALDAEVVRQEILEADQNGVHYDVALSYEARPSTTFEYVVSAGFEDDRAHTRHFDYKAARLAAGFTQVLDKRGTYITGSATARLLDGGHYGAFIHRRDLRLFNRLAVGTSLFPVYGVSIEAAATYSYRTYDPTILLRDYSSAGGELRLVWKFGHGG